MLKTLTRALVFVTGCRLKNKFIVVAPASILNGLVHANFSPLFLLLSLL